MHRYPEELKYSETHEWVRTEDDGDMVVGITDLAQDKLGEIVFVELPDVGAVVSAHDEIGVVESVKAASDIYAPLSGEVVEINEDLEDAPGLVNSDPYGDGWLYKIKIKDMVEHEEMLDVNGYKESVEDEE